jgi:hypothetical protein
MMARRRRLEAKYGADSLDVEGEFEAGVLNGWLAASCWVLGSDSDEPPDT